MKTVILKTPDADPKSTGINSNPYDPENPRKEPQSGPKDITGKDIEKDLIDNDPSKGSQTDIDTEKSNEAQSDTFETIEPKKDNPVEREFETGQLRSAEIKNDSAAMSSRMMNLAREIFNVFGF
jgi:hypothetical protein